MSKPELSIFDETDEAAEALALQQGAADIRAGRVISHAAMVRWLETWGTPDELPPPERGT